jgi:hypothetical protein
VWLPAVVVVVVVVARVALQDEDCSMLVTVNFGGTINTRFGDT